VIRPARADDRQDVGVLMAMLGYPIEGCLLGPAWQGLLDDPSLVLLVCDSGPRAVGVVSARFSVVLHHGGLVGTIESLVVDVEHRGRGLGSSLVREVLVEAGRRGALRVEVGTADGNAFYSRLGFTRIGEKYASEL
jgi:ribosomal protein S18 acetylase RimI-like enzyme